MALSDEHIEKHIRGFTDDYLTRSDIDGGGHAGLSLGIFCGLLAEPAERVGKIAAALKGGRHKTPYSNVDTVLKDDQFYLSPGL